MKLLSRKPGIFFKLLVGYILLLIIMVFPYVLSIKSLDRLSGYASVIADTGIELFKDITGLRNVVPDMGIYARQWVSFRDKNSLYSLMHKSDEFLVLLSDLRRKLSSISSDGTGDACIQIVDKITQETNILKSFASACMQPGFDTVAIEHGGLATAANEVIVTDMVDGLVLRLQLLEKQVRELQAEHLADISKQSDATRQVTGMLLLVAVAFTLAAPVLLYRYLKRPIDSLMRGTEVIGRGDFDKPIPVQGNDELSELARSFNVMASRLRELDALKSDFIAVAGHELRTPLAAMFEAAKLLSEPDIGELNERQAKLVSVLNSSMKRLRGFIDQILELSRLRAGLEVIETRPYDLSKLISDVIETLTPLAWEKGVKIEVKKASGDFTAKVDEERLFRAVMNILHNAIKFSPADGKIRVILDRHVEKGRGEKRRKWCRIGVADGGPGISKEDEGKIFDKFYQIQTVRKKGGAGLGLAIAREIMSAHGGKVWVESPPSAEYAVKKDSGALFWFMLPC